MSLSALAWAAEVRIGDDTRRSDWRIVSIRTCRAALIGIAVKADARGRAEFWFSEIAEITYYSEAMIWRAVQWLETDGKITRLRMGHGGQKSIFQLNVPSLMPGFDLRSAQRQSNGQTPARH